VLAFGEFDFRGYGLTSNAWRYKGVPQHRPIRTGRAAAATFPGQRCICMI
jgi:hypothetical protein